ncbi:MAG: LytTR family DNA-binding domain-containing protein [Gemmatimonadota bacterium]|nr:LytTR family DNA-binding domain-containing protein [Gemmatimonadota bacterium]
MRDIRALLVDDEPWANEGLRAMLQRHADVTVIGECANGRDAVVAIGRDAPDVVFLDVQMPELDGFAVLAEIGCKPRPILIFVTAHDEYALRAFDVQAMDYLLKPVSEEKLGRTVQRVRSQLEQGDALVARERPAQPRPGHAPATQEIEPGSDARNTAVQHTALPYLSRLAVRTGRRQVVVPVTDIDWIAADDYCVNIIANGRRHLMRASLTSLEQRLDPAIFVRVHRSALVNVTRVKEWNQRPFRRLVLVMSDGALLPVSRSRKAHFIELLTGASPKARG